MADISVINVGGSDYNVKDATGRTNANKALTLLAYQETGNTASQAYSTIGTPINWKGTLYYTKTAVAKGATWAVGTNLTAATNLGKLTSNIKTYVNSSGQLVFRDLTGADTVLPFSGTDVIPSGKALKNHNGVMTTINVTKGTMITEDAGANFLIVNVSDFSTVRSSIGAMYNCIGFDSADNLGTAFTINQDVTYTLGNYKYLYIYLSSAIRVTFN